MSFKIETYKDGFVSWMSHVTETCMYSPPDMALDQPHKGQPRPPEEIEFDFGYFSAFTQSGSIRRAQRAVRKAKQSQARRSRARVEVIE